MAKYLAPDHVMLVVSDAERARQFYRDVLGLPSRDYDPDRFFLEDGFEIHLCPVDPGDPSTYAADWATEKGPAFSESFSEAAKHLALRVDDVHAMASKLFTASAQPFSLDVACAMEPIASATQLVNFGTKSVYVRDPDGNLIEFVQEGVSIDRAGVPLEEPAA